MFVRRIALTACIATAIAVPGHAATVDEVIAKHIEARGGKARWDTIQAIKLTGEFTGFSKINPFTLVKQRDGNYYLDHVLGDRKVVVGHDGETAWWDNAWLGEGPQFIAGPDLAVLTRDIDFVNPLFDLEKKGYKAELLGDVEFEGIPAIGIKLDRGDESEETWYLDPKTYLEIGRTSPGSDFGRPMPQRTFYDDFREVQGVKIPFYTETQWYTRDRVMQVENVEINPTVDAAMFRMPPPLGMGPLQSLIGEWQVAIQLRNQPNGNFRDAERVSKIDGLMRGALLQESYQTTQGAEALRTFSYDKFNKKYRMTEIDGSQGQLDVQEGDLGEDGKLIVSNIETGTPQDFGGTKVHSRTSLFDVNEDGFVLEQEVSTDGGENWWVAVKQTYTRKTD